MHYAEQDYISITPVKLLDHWYFLHNIWHHLGDSWVTAVYIAVNIILA